MGFSEEPSTQQSSKGLISEVITLKAVTVTTNMSLQVGSPVPLLGA